MNNKRNRNHNLYSISLHRIIRTVQRIYRYSNPKKRNGLEWSKGNGHEGFASGNESRRRDECVYEERSFGSEEG